MQDARGIYRATLRPGVRQVPTGQRRTMGSPGGVFYLFLTGYHRYIQCDLKNLRGFNITDALANTVLGSELAIAGLILVFQGTILRAYPTTLNII